MKSLSELISLIRFPLCILVVFQHSNFLHGIQSQGERIYIQCANAESMILFFSHIIAHSAVPLFFLISGFLFSFNIQRYSRLEYITKLKKRTKSILLPYLMWNILAELVLWIKYRPFMSSLFPQYTGLSFPYDSLLQDMYVVVRQVGGVCMSDVPQTPINGPLWFIRDLYMMFLLIPFFMLISKEKYRTIVILLLFSIWFFDILPPFLFPGISTLGLAFFFLGFELGLRKYIISNKNFFILKINIPLYICLSIFNILTTTIDVYTGKSIITHITILHHINIVSGVFLIIYLANSISNYSYVKKYIIELGGSTFFIFALHNIINGNILSVLLKVFDFNVHSFSSVISLYFLYVITTIMFCLLLYRCLQRTIILKLLTGNRT